MAGSHSELRFVNSFTISRSFCIKFSFTQLWSLHVNVPSPNGPPWKRKLSCFSENAVFLSHYQLVHTRGRCIPTYIMCSYYTYSAIALHYYKNTLKITELYSPKEECVHYTYYYYYLLIIHRHLKYISIDVCSV